MPSLVSSIIQLVQSAEDAAAPLKTDAEPAGQPANSDIVRPPAESAVETASTRWVN